jgi:hypothetical protein
VPGLLAPSGDVFEHSGVVAEDLEDLSGRQLVHLDDGKEDGQGAETSDHIKAVQNSRHSNLLGPRARPFGRRITGK